MRKLAPTSSLDTAQIPSFHAFPICAAQIDALDIPLQDRFTYAAFAVPFCGHPRSALGDGPWLRLLRKKIYPRFSLRLRLNDAADGGEETMEWRHEYAPPNPAERADPDLSQIGAVVHDDGLVRDALIAQCAVDLIASGYRLGGVVQSNAHRQGRRRCDMYVKDLLGGDEIKISLDRGNEARGCRLDPDAFARIDAWVERAVHERVDLLIINKFGREEVHGRGLRPLIAEVLIAEIPLVIGVSTQNLGDFLTFVGDSATRLKPDIEAMTAWCRNAIERGAHHRFQPRLSSVPA